MLNGQWSMDQRQGKVPRHGALEGVDAQEDAIAGRMGFAQAIGTDRSIDMPCVGGGVVELLVVDGQVVCSSAGIIGAEGILDKSPILEFALRERQQMQVDISPTRPYTGNVGRIAVDGRQRCAVVHHRYACNGVYENRWDIGGLLQNHIAAYCTCNGVGRHTADVILHGIALAIVRQDKGHMPLAVALSHDKVGDERRIDFVIVVTARGHTAQ